MTDNMETELRKAQELVDRIRPILAGNEPEVIGATLCQLLAILVAGHIAPDAVETKRLREAIVEAHIGCLWQLVAAEDGDLETRQ